MARVARAVTRILRAMTCLRLGSSGRLVPALTPIGRGGTLAGSKAVEIIFASSAGGHHEANHRLPAQLSRKPVELLRGQAAVADVQAEQPARAGPVHDHGS